jgi:hypothetical protein
LSHICNIREGQSACPEKGLSNIAISFINSTGGVVGTTDYLVQAQASPNNTVQSAVGRAYIPNSLGTMMYSTVLDSPISTTISPNSSGYARIDTIVLYIDLAVSPDATASNVAKFYDVQGTPNGSPSAPNSAQILAAIGASNPYIVLGNIAVANGFTSINSGNITDTRNFTSFKTGNTVPVNTYVEFTQQGSTPTTPSAGFDRIYFKTDENLYQKNTSGNESAIPTASSTTTLINKRITKRVGTVTSSATPTINTNNYDEYLITALATPITSMTTGLSGTPTEGQTLIIRIKDSGSAQGITWGASFRASSDLSLPTTTIISKTMYCGFFYNSTDSKWDLVACLDNF